MENSRPLFLLTIHRSGGTLLARIYNVHPDIVIWGEHAGLISKLAEMAEIFRHHPQMTIPVGERDIAQFLRTKHTDAAFSPWMNPFELDAFIVWSRAFINQTFAGPLQPGQRWGVKEIRYHTAQTAGFLLTLFPDARFVILLRDLVELCLSNIFAPWSLEHLRLMDAGASEEEASHVVDDCAYALTAIEAGLREIAGAHPAVTKVVSYADLRADPGHLTKELYEFADLAPTPDVLLAAARMRSQKTGDTPPGEPLGVLTRELVERLAPEKLAKARRSIAVRGIDFQRLRCRTGVGAYSFLVGDHEMSRTPLSTLF